MIKEAEGAEGAGGEVFWLGCLIMVNHPDLILSPQGGNGQEAGGKNLTLDYFQ